MDIIGNILYDTIYHSAPIILCVIGGIFAYKANVLNIALEGMMLIGAFVSTLTAFMTQNIALGVLLAVLAALAFWSGFLPYGGYFQGKRDYYRPGNQPACLGHCKICSGADEYLQYHAELYECG